MQLCPFYRRFLALPIAVSKIQWVCATDHSDDTECASCCDAFRKSWFPSLFGFVSSAFVGTDRNRGARVDELILPVCLGRESQYKV